MRIRSRRGLGATVFTWAIVCVGFCLASDPVLAYKSSDASTAIVAWANANIGKYNQYIQYARQKAKPQVPVPPEVDPPCHLCGDNAKTQGEQQVDAWLKQTEEPEATYMKGLAAMSRQVTLDRALGNQLSSAAQKALSQFEDENAFMEDIGKLASRLLDGKAIPMAEKHDKEPRRAYAGIRLLLETAREAAITKGNKSADDEALGLVKTWTESITEKIDKDVVNGHMYNLCPVYAELYRQVELLGGPETNIEQFQKTIAKMQDLLKFNVTLNLKVTTNDEDGGHLYATWVGKAKLRLNLDLAKSCYTPQWESSGVMSVNVTQFDMLSIVRDGNGNKERVPATLVSPHQYSVTVQKPQLDLCDPQPIFQVPLADLMVPQEKVMVKGTVEPTGLLLPFLAAVVDANEFNRPEANQLTGGAAPMPGSGVPQASTDSTNMDAAKAEIQAHQTDTAWLMSPAGQAAIARVQKAALAQAKSKMAGAGVVVPQANTFSQLTSSLVSAHLPWTNGNPDPVNKTLHVKKDSKDIELTVTVDQAKQ